MNTHTKIWFVCAIGASSISGIIFGLRVSHLLHTASLPVIRTRILASHPSLSLTVPTSTTVGAAGSFQVQVKPDEKYLASVNATLHYDPKLIKVAEVSFIKENCPEFNEPIHDEKLGVLTLLCKKPALNSGQALSAIASVKYTPLVAGSSLFSLETTDAIRVESRVLSVK